MNFFNFYKHLTRALQFIMCIIIVKKWGSVGYTYVSLLNFSSYHYEKRNGIML